MLFNDSASCSPQLVTAHGVGDWCAAVMAHHRHITGQPKTGKTSLLVELFARDASPGRCVIDTRGDLQIEHDFLFDPAVTKWNPLAEPVHPELAPKFFAQTIKDAFGYDDLTTPVMSMYLSFVAAALIGNGYNLTDAPRLLTDKQFLAQLTFNNSLVRQFWDSYAALSERDRRQETASTLNKFLGLLLDGRARHLFGVNKRGLSLGDMANKTMLVRLPVHEYGVETVALIGSLLLAYLGQLIRTPYAIYVEDANLFAKGTLSQLLNQSDISITMTHQYLAQLDDKLLAAIIGNCAERYIFRVSKADAEYLAQDLPPMSSKKSLDELDRFTYRSIPYSRLYPDKITIPLEKRL